MKLLQFIIALYLTGYMVFSVSGITGTDWTVWDFAYFISVDSAGVGFLTWLLLYQIVKPFRRPILPLVWFSGAVLAWDLFSFLTGRWVSLNHPTAVSICFLAATIIVVILIFIEWPKSK